MMPRCLQKLDGLFSVIEVLPLSGTVFLVSFAFAIRLDLGAVSTSTFIYIFQYGNINITGNISCQKPLDPSYDKGAVRPHWCLSLLRGVEIVLDKIPQVFISYSWTSQEYQEYIINIAKRMCHDGIDVKLDVWDLKDGQDKYVFMETCVSDPNIDNVLIMSDKEYAEKADNRSGGVGDETTIISRLLA